jgi:putative membrane protein
MTFSWSKWPFIVGFLYALALCTAHALLDIHFALPWQPISVIGIAVAFYLGFKNNSSYDRTWEARKIWGGIVNTSRSFGAQVVSFLQGDNAEIIKKELIYRHIAWLTALRFQLRLPREWEHTDERLKKYYWPSTEEMTSVLDTELRKYISQAEVNQYTERSNIATQILAKQSERLQQLRDKDYFEDFRHMELVHLISALYDGQGASERIKNFPFPRQYSSTALWLTVVFCAILPFGIIDVFHDYSGPMFWICPFIVGLITWIFFLMEKIGDYSENPFEGTYNDVPITTISRGIEIDMREMINDTNIPKAIAPENGFSL